MSAFSGEKEKNIRFFYLHHFSLLLPLLLPLPLSSFFFFFSSFFFFFSASSFFFFSPLLLTSHPLFLSVPLFLSIQLAQSYTLGGFYLARYDDSPCGAFDELVALAGIAWEPPVSAAWAAKVLVSNAEARSHGRRSCGLPSAAASFSSVSSSSFSSAAAAAAAAGAREGITVTSPASPSSREAFDFSHPESSSSSRSRSSRFSRSSSCWWHPREEKCSVVVVRNEDERGGGGIWRRRRRSRGGAGGGGGGGGGNFICSLELPALPRTSRDEFVGPRLSLKLPSFSGATPECPGLLKYACDLSARVRLVKPVVVRSCGRSVRGERDDKDDENADCLSAVLGGKPLLCLEFGDMRMRVKQPQPALIGEKKAGKKRWWRGEQQQPSSSSSSRGARCSLSEGEIPFAKSDF